MSTERLQVAVPVLGMRSSPDGRSLTTQLLRGELIDVPSGSTGIVHGVSVADGYSGYVDRAGLRAALATTTRVTALTAPLYPEPTLKCVPIAHLSWQSRLHVTGQTGDYLHVGDGYVWHGHTGGPAVDWVAEAGRLIGRPYIWGGRSAIGLDCSALVQLSLHSCDLSSPRDSHEQEDVLGQHLPDDATLQRGDLIFWKGHVGIMEDPENLLHATANTMNVTREPLEGAIARIAAAGEGPVTARKRL